MKNHGDEFKKGLADTVFIEFSEIPQEDEIEWEFSQKFNIQTQKLLNSQCKSYWKIINTATKRVAILAVVILLFVCSLLSIDSVRVTAADAIKSVVVKTKNILNISDEKAADILGTASDGSFKHTEFYYDLPETQGQTDDTLVQNETFDNPKTEIYNKMLNTIDYFGKIEMTIETSMLDGENARIEYYSDIDSVTAYEAVYKGEILTNETYCDGKTMFLINNADKVYEKSHMMIYRREDAPYIPLKKRVFTETDGIPAYRYRANITNCPLASISIFPQGLIYSYLGDFERWQITDNNAEFLGVDCIKISGTTAPYTANKHNNDSFIILVDKNTGILLKFEAYKNGTCTQYITTTKFVINGNPNIKSFDSNSYSTFTEVYR